MFHALISTHRMGKSRIPCGNFPRLLRRLFKYFFNYFSGGGSSGRKLNHTRISTATMPAAVKITVVNLTPYRGRGKDLIQKLNWRW